MCCVIEVMGVDEKDYVYAFGILATAGIGIWNALNHIKTNKKTAFINIKKI